ncbi:MAG: hypothetical protein JWQ25_2347 [Daejeonella sp.]|nr:hypothetical protein [Daejeonella sp.]
MKKIIIMALFIMGAQHSFAQTDSLKVEQFCQIIARPRLFSSRVTIDMDFGGEKKFWNDTRLKSQQGQVRKFNTVVDAMNFMAKEGWTFMNAYPVKTYGVEIYHLAFKKLASKSDLL